MTNDRQQSCFIVICAPSGTGKSTLLEKLKKNWPQLVWSVSCTTRPKREGEVEGRDYFFISKEAFEEKLKRNDFIEWATVHKNFYGTSRSYLEKSIHKGDSILLDLDVQGADSMKKIYGPKAQVVFIEPPSLTELEKRLRTRGKDSDEVINVRLENAKQEILRKNDYDFLITNADLDVAYSQLEQTVKKILSK
jgi:guanylate kinase